ncbi:isoprenoid synthase domain-containing protein [Butyriboletus roseoflavus]|nr:isoprenoid synthase domain-containing protein [Butyriboletus roseoflavus]
MSTWLSATSGLRLSRPAFTSPQLARHARRQSASAFATPQPSASSSHARSSPLSSSKTVDPHALLKAEITHVRSSLLNLLGSSHPTLSQIASYYFHHPSKQLRPLLVLLFSRATNGLGSHFPLKHWSAEHSRLSAEQLDAPLSRPDVLNDFNPSMPDHTASFNSPFDLRPPPTNAYPSPPPSLCADPAVSLPQLAHTLLPTQLRLAQIVEMIHVASLLHDDVIDKSDLRRGAPSAPAAFGNKLAVLGGDFLLGRASAALSRLGDSEVVELIASVIANLVEGEILQMKGTGARTNVDALSSPHPPPSGEIDISSILAQPSRAEAPCPDRWNTYLKKTYLKTASLMAKGARAAVVLGGCREGEVWKEVAYAYGRNVGIAFQLVDDILDFSSSTALGKPGSGADLRLGLATGPVLYAAEEYPELEPLIARGFKHDGDVERALSLIHASSGVSRTRDLAQAYAEKAREVLGVLPASEAREALEALTDGVVRRGWQDLVIFSNLRLFMQPLAAISLLLFALLVTAHGDHGDAGENLKLANAEYAVRHVRPYADFGRVSQTFARASDISVPLQMASEHHIDSFDLESFFQLHDLNRDGVWDREEIEAIYGVHHVYSQKKSKDETEHQKKADHIVDTVLKLMDKSGDGKVTPEEFASAGFKGLPSFDDIGAEGHHYDVESEQFHSTPETQTDEAYNHPEDMEHFGHHENIEILEAEREAKFQGITVEEALRSHEEHPAKPESAPRPKITRGVPKQDPAVKYKDIEKETENQSEWGAGDQGYKQPKSPVERMRKNLPYKVREYARAERDADGPLTPRNVCSTNSGVVGATFNHYMHPSIFHAVALPCYSLKSHTHFYTLTSMSPCLHFRTSYSAFYKSDERLRS